MERDCHMMRTSGADIFRAVGGEEQLDSRVVERKEILKKSGTFEARSSPGPGSD